MTSRQIATKMYFGTDANNDNKFDVGAPTTYANITMPCP